MAEPVSTSAASIPMVVPMNAITTPMIAPNTTDRSSPTGSSHSPMLLRPTFAVVAIFTLDSRKSHGSLQSGQTDGRPELVHRPPDLNLRRGGMATRDALQIQARALGDPSRHRIFRYVAEASGPVGVAELTDHL